MFPDTSQLVLSIILLIVLSIGVDFAVNAIRDLFPGAFLASFQEHAFQSNLRCFLDRHILLIFNDPCIGPKYYRRPGIHLFNVMVLGTLVFYYWGLLVSLGPPVPVQGPMSQISGIMPFLQDSPHLLHPAFTGA